jgi:hypothetical protein
MATINRFVTTITGTAVVGGGVSITYATSVASYLTAWKAFWAGLNTWLPLGVTVTFPGTGDIIDAATGHLTGSWVSSAPTIVTGTGNTPFPANSGACVLWNTGIVKTPGNPARKPYKIRGKLFVVPLDGSQYTTTGTLQASTVTGLTTQANNFITAAAGSFVVWSRPEAPYADGEGAAVVSAQVHQKVASLTSRRD